MNKKLLHFGIFQTLAMALYHFYLPFQFAWATHVGDLQATIKWSLFGLNNYFSFILLMVSLALLFVVLKRPSEKFASFILSAIILAFWTFSFVYQLVEPMPLPASLGFLSYLLPGIALFNAALFGLIVYKLK